MTLAYSDVLAPNITRTLPRLKGELRLNYCQRFFREVTGLGSVILWKVKGNRRVRIARRGF